MKITDSQLIEVQVLVESLILSPLNSKQENIEMFNKWLNKVYL